MWALVAGIAKHKSLIKEKRKKYDKIVLLAKATLNRFEVLISRTLIGTCNSYDEFVSVNKVFRKHNKTKEKIKTPETCVEYTI